VPPDGFRQDSSETYGVTVFCATNQGEETKEMNTKVANVIAVLIVILAWIERNCLT